MINILYFSTTTIVILPEKTMEVEKADSVTDFHKVHQP
jgi:hypothetical protein